MSTYCSTCGLERTHWKGCVGSERVAIPERPERIASYAPPAPMSRREKVIKIAQIYREAEGHQRGAGLRAVCSYLDVGTQAAYSYINDAKDLGLINLHPTTGENQ